MADAELTTDIIDYQLDGSADDGDPGTVANPGTYHSSKAALKGRNAVDGASKAGSDIPKHNEVGGNANAIPGNVGESARATSFNQVATKFVIQKQGGYTFAMKLDAQVKTAGQGTVEIRQRANILSATGTAILIDPANPAKGVRPDTALGDSTSTFSGNGTHKVSESSTAPDNLKVTLEKGDYRLELELRLVANAPASDAKSLAEINDATLSIELK